MPIDPLPREGRLLLAVLALAALALGGPSVARQNAGKLPARAA